MSVHVRMTINGEPRELDVPEQRLLIDAIRYDIGLTGTKLGCGVGQTVIIDSDGKGARELIGSEKTPARWYTVGIVDE